MVVGEGGAFPLDISDQLEMQQEHGRHKQIETNKQDEVDKIVME